MRKEVIKIGNYALKKTQGRSVYSGGGIAPTLTAGMTHGNTVPFIVVKENDNHRWRTETPGN